MCDYSLEYVASRPALVGDKLVITRFSGSLTRGFAAITQANVAVCLLPGTELAFDREVERETIFGSVRTRNLGHKVARFRRINEGKRCAHHDALEFPSGETVLLTYLREGQHATVLQLPVPTGNTSAVEERESASVPV